MKIDIGTRIRKLRKKHNVTIQELCNKTGLSYSFLSNLENNKHSITVSNLSKIANFFKVELSYFFLEDDLIKR
jgi:transcriptional regulator with XRE-family HTH domain